MINSRTKKMVAAALCIALGVVLPMFFHWLPNAGSILLPMHLPVLLCGILCGWQYGLAAGIATPLISHLFTGMPPAPFLPSMLLELAVYGLVAGLLYKLIKTKNKMPRTYIALIGAMIIGRIVYGAVNALIFRAGDYSLSIWFTGVFVTGIIGIAAQIILIPAITFALDKAGLAD